MSTKKTLEQDKKEKFEHYKKQIEEDYVDLNSDELEAMYEKFCDLGFNNLSMDFGGTYHKFLNFVLENSSDKNEYLEDMIEEYQNESDSEDDEEEEDDNYDDIYERK
jgi:hypothetical protein